MTSRLRGSDAQVSEAPLSDHLFQGERVFGFDPVELANRKPAARMALQVFDVGSRAGAGFF